MKKTLTILMIGLFLIPTISFAQTIQPSRTAIILQLIQLLTQQVEILQSKIEDQSSNANDTVTPIQVTIGNTGSLFIQNRDYLLDRNSGVGTFDISFNVTANSQDLYIPMNIGTTATSGVAYILSGTAIPTTSLQCFGKDIQVVDTDSNYCKIPAGDTAQFAFEAKINGKVGDTYGIAIGQVRYKTDPLSTTLYSYNAPSNLKTEPLLFESPD